MSAGSMQRPAMIATVVGGLLAVASVFLAWSKEGFVTTGPLGTEHGDTTSTAGISATGGKIVLALGIIVIGAAIARMLLQGATGRMIAGLVAVVGGLVILGLGIKEVLDISTEESLVISGITESGEEVTIGSETSVGIGLWLTIAAGAIAAAGAALGFRGARRPEVTGMAPPA